VNNCGEPGEHRKPGIDVVSVGKWKYHQIYYERKLQKFNIVQFG